MAFGLALLGLAAPLLWRILQGASPLDLPVAQLEFFRAVADLLAVVVSMLICITGYRAIMSHRKAATVWLGVAFLGVGLFEVLHLLSYSSMPDVITPNTPVKPAFFWLAARLLAALALLVYALLPLHSEVSLPRKRFALGIMLFVVGAVAYAGLIWPESFPALVDSAGKATTLKNGLESLVLGLHLTTLVVFWFRRKVLAGECLMALVFAVALSCVSEIFVLLPVDRDANSAVVLGHAYKVLAYLYLFHATFHEAMRRPLEHIHRQHLRENVTLSAAPDGVLWVDDSGRILTANPAMETLSGYRPEQLLGKNVDIFLPQHLRASHGNSVRDFFVNPHPRAMGNMDLKLMRKDGSMLPVDISLGKWIENGQNHAIAYIRDLTERKKFEESLRHKATHDELTGLPNRWMYQLQLNQALAHAGRNRQRVAVLLLDLDYFKTINDSFGHAAGDALLVQAGNRMRSTLRESDLLARLGGDEFAVLLTELADADEAVSVATKVLAALQEAYVLQGHDVYSGGSVGLSFFPDDAQDGDTLLRYADLAMYQAKQAGRGTYACYSQNMDVRVHEDMLLHTRLKEALATGALELHYQPQVDVESGNVTGAEALLRWQDPVLGDVTPSRFIPVAEATGLILPLGDWVLETACQQIATWTRIGLPVRVAVNFSAQQFRRFDLADKVRAVLERTGAQAQWLDIEITESMAMTQPEQARKQLEALVALGCSVALDDFGTGYSSLAYLKTLPVSKLKIDKSFMDGIPHDGNDVAISRAIIALAHSLGLTLVAEGVETDAQLAFLRQYGCETYQGWLFAKAMPAEAMTQRMSDLAPLSDL